MYNGEREILGMVENHNWEIVGNKHKKGANRNGITPNLNLKALNL